MEIMYVLLAIYAGKFGQTTTVAIFPDVYSCTGYAQEHFGKGSGDYGTDWVCMPTPKGTVTSSTGVLENPTWGNPETE